MKGMETVNLMWKYVSCFPETYPASTIQVHLTMASYHVHQEIRFSHFSNTPKSSIPGRRTVLMQHFPKFCAFIWYYTQVCGRSFQKAITTHHRLRGISSYQTAKQTEAVALFRLPTPHLLLISLTWDSKHIHSSKNTIDFALKNKYTSIFVYLCSKS